MKVTVQKIEGNPDDFKQIAELLMSFAAEHSMGGLSAGKYDPMRSVAWIVKNIECLVLAAFVDGVAVGSIGLHKTTPWYSDTPYLTDGWLYVLPDHRQSAIGVTLIEEAKRFAKEQHLPLVLNIFNMEDTEIKIKLLRRKGFKLIGGTFVFGE
jgi:GNAT superfamily N-acetyltransferase